MPRTFHHTFAIVTRNVLPGSDRRRRRDRFLDVDEAWRAACGTASVDVQQHDETAPAQGAAPLHPIGRIENAYRRLALHRIAQHAANQRGPAGFEQRMNRLLLDV